MNLDTPIFVYGASDVATPGGDDSSLIVLDLPAMLPTTSAMTVGGDIEADSGMRASYRILDSELMALTLRFYETQWPYIVDLIDLTMNGQIFLFYPESTPPYNGYFVRLDSPAPGTPYIAQPDGQYPRALTLTIVLRPESGTFDDFDFQTATTETLNFGVGPSDGKAMNTLYHDVTKTVGTVTATWPNYVPPGTAGSPGWQGVIGTGGNSADPQQVIFDKLVKRVQIDFEEITFYDNWMEAYDEDDVLIERCTLSVNWMVTLGHGKTAIIDAGSNRIKRIVMSGNFSDWITYTNLIVTRDGFLDGES